MSSAPSACALTAVLRCRRNIWTRNPPSTQPLSAAHSLGTAGWPAERARPHTASAWEAIAPRERVTMGNILTVVVESLEVGVRVLCRSSITGLDATPPLQKQLALNVKNGSLQVSFRDLRPFANTVQSGRLIYDAAFCGGVKVLLFSSGLSSWWHLRQTGFWTKGHRGGTRLRA